MASAAALLSMYAQPWIPSSWTISTPSRATRYASCRVLTGRGEAQVDAGPQLGIDEPVRVACRDRSDERDDPLTRSARSCQGGSSGHQELDRLARQVEALSRRQDVIDDRDGVCVPADQQIAPGELTDQLDVLGRLAQVAVLVPGRLYDRRRFPDPAVALRANE